MIRKLILASNGSTGTPKLFQCAFDKPLHEVKLLCIPTASNVYDEKPWLYREIKQFENAGFSLTYFELEGKTQQEVEKALQNHDGVYVTGGNTYYLLEHAKKSNFEKAVKDFLDKGGIYIGTSAGAVLTTPDIGYIGELDDATKGNPENYQGMSLVNFLIKVHIKDLKTSSDKYLNNTDKYKNFLSFGITDNQFLFIEGHEVKIGEIDA